MIEALSQYLDQSQAGTTTVVTQRSVPALKRRLRLASLAAQGDLAKKLGPFLEEYLANTTRLHHPAAMAHQVAVPHPLAALADAIHGLTNNPMAIYEMGPAAAAIEVFVIDWMLKRVGWASQHPAGEQAASAGVLTHGGSLANLTALLAARAALAPLAWEAGTPADLVVLVPPSSHYSIARAISILGLGARAVRSIPVDAAEVIDVAGLERLYRAVRQEGKRVMAVVANAGSTSTGLFDPIEAVGKFCRAEGLWFHVDGAHGASALTSSRHRERLRGVEVADSLIWDAHKMLRTSGLCTALLCRDGKALDRAFHQEASYLFYGDEHAGVDVIHRTVECTKAGLGLKAFFSLAMLGEKGLARYWDRQYATAARFAALIRARPGFECPFEPQSNVVCFRFGTGDDALQTAIRGRLLEQGRYHISSTEVCGRRYLRLALMSPQTDERTLQGLLLAIEQIGHRLVAERRDAAPESITAAATTDVAASPRRDTPARY